jgi:hypothetical protein
MKTGVYCPFCAADLFDPGLDRCTQCGMFVPDHLRSVLTQKFSALAGSGGGLAAVAASESSPAGSTGGDGAGESIPVAAVAVASEAGRETSDALAWQDLNLLAAQQTARRQFWQRVWLQVGWGWIVWSAMIIPLGRSGAGVPFSWLPASLGMIACLAGVSRGYFAWSVAGWIAAVVVMFIAWWF